MVIRLLAPEVQAQIAAGEVIERPASVVKELIDNALDAGALRLRIAIRGGGAERIEVIDDGCGFLAEDLPLAFVSHATSKLAALSDLDHISSLGFRGEALASIGSVARCRIVSRPDGADAGHELRCDGGVFSAVMPCSSPNGSRIEIADLFYNTPARRRFLRTPQSERAKIQETVALSALARLDVDFTLVSDDRELLRLPAGESLQERFGRCFGRDLLGGLLPVERAFGSLRVVGLLGEPDLARRDSKLELLYVNGRRAGEKSATQAIRQAYREYLMGGRMPVYCLQVQLPPDQVDVNVHPRKTDVRFLDSRKVAGCLYATAQEALVGRAGVQGAAGIMVGEEMPRARSGFPDLPAGLFGGDLPAAPAPSRPVDAPWVVRETPSHAAAAAAAPAAPLSAGKPNPFQRASGRFLQIMDLYLLLESPDGLLVVDQHALHERVVYERLLRQHEAREVAIQRLLTPAVVELLPSDKQWLLAARDTLAAEGLLLDDFGGHAVAVHGLPAVLARTDPHKLLRALLEHQDGESLPRAGEAIAERFHSMACRAAVMSGDRLTDAEIAALLQQAAALEHPHNCPHGRPTVLTFSPAELERYFRRRC